MTQHVVVELDIPAGLEMFKRPEAVHRRSPSLLDGRDSDEILSTTEHQEAAALVDLAELLRLLGLRAKRLPRQ